MVFVRVHVIKGRLTAAQKDELGAKLIQAVSDVEGLVNTPEQAEEALAIVYGPGRHTGSELSSYAEALPAQGRG